MTITGDRPERLRKDDQIMSKKKAPTKSQDNGTPDKEKYPHGEKEQPIGSWWNPEPEEQYKEHGIGNSH